MPILTHGRSGPLSARLERLVARVRERAIRDDRADDEPGDDDREATKRPGENNPPGPTVS